MRNTLILLFSFTLGCGIPAFSQQNDSIRSLRNAVGSAKDGQEKTNSLNRLSEYLLRTGDIAGSNAAAREALVEAEKHGIISERAAALDNLGKIFEAKFDYTNAMKMYVESLKAREATSDQTAIALSNHRIGHLFLLQNDFDNALPNLEKALEARKISGDMGALAETHRVLGDLWRKKKIFGKAQEYYRAAIDEKIEINDLPSAAEIAGLLGKLAFELGDNEGSLVYFRQSFDLNSSTENLRAMGFDNINMGKAYLNQQSLSEALSAFQSAQSLFNDCKDSLGIAQSLENQASILAKTGRSNEAEKLLQDATNILAAMSPVPGVPEAYESIASTYRTMGNVSKAYDNLLMYNKAKETVFGLEKNKALVELTTRYQSEFAAEEQLRTIKQLEIEQSSAQKVRWALLGILFFAALALWSLWKNNVNKRKDNKLLQSKNAEIDAKNAELNLKNAKLDDLNNRLVGEIANRELLEQNAFNRDQFLTILSREMRAPLNDILSYSRTLLADKPRNGKGEALQNIQFSANNLLVLVNDLLDYSHIETGKIVLENMEFEPKKVIADLEKRFSPVFREKASNLTIDLDPQIPIKLNGDPGRFNQILTNLLNNTVNHTKVGDTHMHIHAVDQGDETCALKIEINALGTLLDSEELKALEQPHLAAVELVMGERSGHSIGLVLAKRLVGLQNGQFKAENFGTEGLTFSMTLPFQKTTKKPSAYGNTMPNTQALEGKYILVAEDNKINQLVVMKMLQKVGAVVVTADDGMAALEAFNNGYFDLILMDIQMPKLDGYRTVAEMRKSEDSRKKVTPIIALTASAYLTDKDKAELFQMNDHIGKPFSPEEMLDKVIRSLTEKEAK